MKPRVLTRLGIGTLLIATVLSASAQQSQEAFARAMQEAKLKKTEAAASLPKKDLLRHVSSIPLMERKELMQLAASLIEEARKDPQGILLKQWDDYLAHNDSSAANTGLLLYLSGKGGPLPLYLVAYGVQKTGDPWAVNSLGVVLQNRSLYEKAYRCFAYADRQVKQPSAILKTNLGWAAAYLGDFEAAKKSFEAALQLRPGHEGAWEGLATLATVEGDNKTLWRYLTRHLTAGGGSKPQPPSPRMLDLIEESSRRNEALRKSDPFDNHLYDNGNPEDNADDPGGAPSVVPDLPTMQAFLSDDLFTLNREMDAIRSFKKQILAGQAAQQKSLQEEWRSLPPWKTDAYTDAKGMLVLPYNYEPALRLFERITVEFNKRDIWLSKQMSQEEMDLWKTLSAANAPLIEQRMKCKDEDCLCQLAKTLLGAAQQTHAAGLDFWAKWKKKFADNWNWYIAATSAVIRKVHPDPLNAYLNHKRAAVVRAYIENKYLGALDYCLRGGGLIDLFGIKEACAKEPPKSFKGGSEAERVPLKKLQTWPEPCHVPTGDYDGDVAALFMTCEGIRVRLGPEALSLNLEKTFGDRESRDVTKLYIESKLEKEGAVDIHAGSHTIGAVKASAEASADLFLQFQDGKLVNYGIEGSAGAGVSAGAKSGSETLDKALSGDLISAGGSFIISAETGIRGSARPLEGGLTQLLQNPN